MFELAVDGIVFEEMREGGRVGDVVDGDDLEVALGESGAHEHPANSAEAVNSNFNRHRSILPREPRAKRVILEP
jgi:hypothetical protein